MENNNNELVVYGQNGEILDCRFQRVDFNNPPTVISYCDDAIDAIAGVLENSSKLSVGTPQETLDAKKIDEITNFDETLDEGNEKLENPGLIVRAKKSLGALLSKIGITSLEEHLREESLQDLHDQQQEMLTEVKEILVRQIERITMGIELTGDIINETTPLIQQLDAMVEVGRSDLAAFREETEVLAASVDPTDIKAQRPINIRRKVADVFDEKLNQLANMSISYDQAMEEYQIQQLTDMALVGVKTGQIKHGIPMMRTQADLMVRGKEQTKAIAEAKALDVAFNDAIKKNSDVILINANETLDLSVNGGIKTETHEYVRERISKAVEVYRSRDKKIKERIAKDAQTRDKLIAQRNKDKQDILSLFEENLLTEGFTAENPQKRLGGK